jgi:hypothetical protein
VADPQDLPRLGLVITTIGRLALTSLLDSVLRSSVHPTCVTVANQSGGPLPLDTAAYPFPIVLVPSSGGVSRGRNDAAAALDPACEVLGFPNDDSTYDDSTCLEVLRTFQRTPRPAAVACSLLEAAGTRFALPAAGALLDRRTVWRAIEAGTFVTREAFEAVGGFTPDIGSGAPSPWGSGEGTDILLRIMEQGGRIVSRPDLAVHGTGERRHLDDDQLVAKHRAYARGTGRVYRVHGYPLSAQLRILVGPWARPHKHDPNLRLSLRLASARTLGRLEGLTGRVLGDAAARGRTPAELRQP